MSFTQTQINGATQIRSGSISNAQISSSAAIATSKLADGSLFIKSDGSVAFGANQSMGGNRLTNLAAPSAANDAARLADVQAATNGLDVKASVRAKSDGLDIDLSSALINGLVMDGVTLATGDRVLLTDQSLAKENGIYVVVASGAASRSPDADSGAEVTANMFTFVEEGTINHDTGWVLVTNNPIVLDTDPLAFSQFSGSSAVTGASNVGSGQGVFKDLNISTLEFKSIKQGAAGKVTVASNTNDLTLDIGAGTLVNVDISSSAAIARSKLASGSNNYVVVNNGSGVMSEVQFLSIAQGGTNSNAALNNNRIMISSGGAIVEQAAITASRALASDSNGLPVASSVTATELGYVSGVTSAIQTQLNAKLSSSNFVVREVPSGTIDGSNAAFSLANTPIAGSEMIFQNGLLLESGASFDYTISGASITFNAAPSSGDLIIVSYMK